jgi:small conductance mechanosensitive channel
MDANDIAGSASEAAEEVTTQVSEQMSFITNWINGFADNALDMVVKIIFALLIFFIGRKILKVLTKLFKTVMNKSNIDVTVVKFLSVLLEATGYIVIVVIVLGTLGYEATSLAAIVGSAGVAVGLAMQGSLSNFAGGVLILVLRPFKVGDYIIEGGNEGTVKQIGLVYTEILTVDNKLVIIPNGSLSNDRLINVTAMDKRRVDIGMTLSYKADLQLTKKILTGVIQKQEKVLLEEGITVVVTELSETGVCLECRCWASTDDYWDVKGSLTEKFKMALDDAGLPLESTITGVHLAK